MPIQSLDDIVALSPNPVAIWSRDGHFVRANLAYLEMFKGHPTPDYSLWTDPVILKTNFATEFLQLRQGQARHFPPIHYNSRDAHPQAPDNPIVFETVVYPLFGSEDRIEQFLFLYINRTEQYRLKSDLRQAEEAIKKLAEDYEQQKRRIGDAISALRCSWTRAQLVSQFGLTVTEARLCELVRDGRSGKEIAAELGVAFSTIHTHKINVRRKLGLRGEREGLCAFLTRLDLTK